MKATIKCTIEAPDECTEEQFREWLYYSLNLRADIKLDNPLCDEDIEPKNYEIDIEQ